MSWLFASGGQSIGASASASVLPVNIQGWFLYDWLVCSPSQCKDNEISFVSTWKVRENLMLPAHIRQRHTTIVRAGASITWEALWKYASLGPTCRVSGMSPRTCISSKFPGDGCWSKTTVELVCITWQMMNSSRVCWSTARETSCETASATRTSFLELRDAEGFPGGSVGKESACQAADCLQCRRPGFRSLRQEDSLEKKIPWAEEPGGYSPWGHKVGHNWACTLRDATQEMCPCTSVPGPRSAG